MLKIFRKKETKPAPRVRDLPVLTYGRILEIDTPVRFYWNKDGSFDGIEFTVDKLSESEILLVKDVLLQMQLVLDKYRDWNLKDITD